jgi:hypothetical protein
MADNNDEAIPQRPKPNDWIITDHLNFAYSRDSFTVYHPFWISLINCHVPAEMKGYGSVSISATTITNDGKEERWLR